MRIRRSGTLWRSLLGLFVLTGCLAHAVGGSSMLTKAEEREIGQKVLQQVHQHFQVLDDPYLTSYLDDIGDRLTRAMGADEFRMHFNVVADPRINAFAVPGGYIFITSQTMLKCADESELAGVVAHEMGHVEGRHIAYRMQKATRVNLAAMAAVLAGALLGGGGSEAGAAVSTFGLAAAQTKMLQYSREDEEDADRRALRALTASNYDGWGLVRFMETIHKEAPTPEGVPAYLFTHPLPANRASYIADALPSESEERPDAAALGPLWRAQARVLVQDPRPWGLEFFRVRAEDNPKSPDANLGLALLLCAQGRYEEALGSAQTAEHLAPGDPEILHEEAVILLRQGRTTEAVEVLERTRADKTATVAALRDLGWTYLEADEGAKALSVYDELAEKDPGWPKLKYYRGMALGKAGRAGEAHEALGDYYRGTGKKDLAARQYREALRRLPDAASRARVEQALAEVEGGTP